MLCVTSEVTARITGLLVHQLALQLTIGLRSAPRAAMEHATLTGKRSIYVHGSERTLAAPPEGPPDSHTSPTVMFPSTEQSVAIGCSAPAALKGEAVTAFNMYSRPFQLSCRIGPCSWDLL